MDASLVNALNHRMNYLVERQGVVSGNVANANTPGYITRDLQFQKMVEANKSVGMTLTNKHHIKGMNRASDTGTEVKDYSNIKHNGNSVKLDEEMLKMNETQLDYGLVTQLYKKNKQMQQLVLSGAQR